MCAGVYMYMYMELCKTMLAIINLIEMRTSDKCFSWERDSEQSSECYRSVYN